MVDFAALTGGVQDRCAPGDPSSGVAALRGAGFEPTRAAQQPGYFLCRIDGKPATDPCQRASPEDAYWSYWHGQPGGTWRYSGSGAADYDPAPGSIEGWAFGAGKPPSIAPPPRAAASRSARSSPQSTPAAEPSAAPPAATAASARPTTTPTRPQPTAAGSAAASAPAPRSTTATRPAEPAVSSAPGGSPVAAPSPDPPTDSGIGLGPIVALVLVAGLGAGAVVQARRRA